MNEFENNAPKSENAEALQEAPVAELQSAPETEITAAPETATAAKEKKRKGAGAIKVILFVILVIAVAVGSFILGRSLDFDLDEIFASCNSKTGNGTEEAPEFLGVWSNDKHAFYISAGGIIEIDGASYSYTWDAKTITIKTDDGESYAIRYKKMSNTLKLWLEEDRDDSVSVRRNSRENPDELCGAWTLGDTEICFNADGTAEIYGKSYTYTADSYEITCKSKSGNEYMFYTVDGDFLKLWLPGGSDRTLTFVKSDSLVPGLMGTWVSDESEEYLVCHADGTVELSGLEEEYFGEEISAYVEDESLVLRIGEVKVPFDVELDNDSLKLFYLGENLASFYRISTETDLSIDEIELLWDMYSPTEAM